MPYEPEDSLLSQQMVREEGELRYDVSKIGDKFDFVPKALARLNAGGGSVVMSEENGGERYAFRRDWLRGVSTGRTNVLLVDVEGDSMEPTIRNGATVMVDRGRTEIQGGNIYAIGIDDTIVVKRLELLPGNKIRISSDNKSDYQPYVARLEDIRVIGRIIWVGTTL